MGLEGVVSKRLGSRYRLGRSPDGLGQVRAMTKLTMRMIKGDFVVTRAGR
jgi:ATP-dependent DNA ligase